jgi:hypothetical protein
VFDTTDELVRKIRLGEDSLLGLVGKELRLTMCGRPFDRDGEEVPA